MFKTSYLKTSGALAFGLLASMTYFVAVSSPVAAGAGCVFASKGTIDFNTAANWSCGHVPIASDDAVIPTNTTTIMSSPATVNSLTIQSGGGLVMTGQDLTVMDSVSCSGAIAGGNNTLSIGNDLTFLSGFSFTPANSTVMFTTSTSDGTFLHQLTAPTDVNFNNLVVSSTQYFRPSSAVLFNLDGNLTITQGVMHLVNGADVTVAGTVEIKPLGALALMGSSNIFTANGTTTNNGTMGSLNSGVLILNNDYINNGTVQGAMGETYGLTIKGNWTNAGTFNSGSSTVTLNGSKPQAITGDLKFNNLNVSGSGKKTFSGNVTTTGSVVVGRDINFSNKTFEILGDIDNSSGLENAKVRVTGGGDQLWSGNGYLASGSELVVLKPGGTTLTFNGTHEFDCLVRLVSGIMKGGTLLKFYTGGSLIMAGGTFDPDNGEVLHFQNGGNYGIASTTYNILQIQPDTYNTLYKLSATTTILGSVSLSLKARLDLQGNTLIASGLFVNGGLITLNGGHIIHPAESAKITDSAGADVTALSTGGLLYVTVQDANRNLASSTAETINVTITTNAAAGNDSETLTLLETSPTSGIFRNTTTLQVVNGAVTTGNGKVDLTGSGILTMNYVDAQDSSDTASDTATLTYIVPPVVSSGGGGLSDYSVPKLSPLVTQQQLLSNLQNINVTVHSLVKLPDDGKVSTQEDSAVYYIATDGKRHAFPNDKVYFTWYSNFDQVKVISASQLASIPLGSNVTYKPGKKMVKFTTDPKVYVVAKGGILRWIVSEAAAKELYGVDWSKNIDDINDAFYVNYQFGNSVSGLADFNPTAVQASAPLPSDSLQM